VRSSLLPRPRMTAPASMSTRRPVVLLKLPANLVFQNPSSSRGNNIQSIRRGVSRASQYAQEGLQSIACLNFLGFLTCNRTRRVKCDEGRPSCERCIRFGCTCDGYRETLPQAQSAVKPLRASILPRLRNQRITIYSLSDLTGTYEDKKCFNFFQLQTSSQLSGHFDAGFWTCSLLQISRSEPIVWHSVLAFSKLHEQYTVSYDQRKFQLSKCGYRFALEHYNESVAGMAGALTDLSHSTEVILVNCIVFIGLELLLHNTEGAMAHLRCGLQVLRAWRERKSNSSWDRSASHSGLMERHLLPMFGHMNLHASAMYGSLGMPQPEYLTVRKVKRYGSFKDLVQARGVLLDIMNEGLQLAGHATALGKSPSKDRKAFEQKQSLISRSRGWEIAFGAFLSEPSMKYLSLEDSQKVSLLWIKHKTASIWISNSLCKDETSFDNYVTDFDDIISRAESVFEKELDLLKGEEYANFSVQMQVISLHYTTVKCRNPSIRRRALALLERCSRAEGFWDSKMVIKIAKRVIGIEEEGMDEQTDLTGSVVPSEWSRIHGFEVTPARVGSSRRALISFKQWPTSDHRQWLLREEYFEI
jgi:hypothetical protein